MPCFNRTAAHLAGLTRRGLIACAAASLLPLATACASEPPLRSSPVEMALIDRDSGQVLTVYRKDGRGYVAGRPTARYAIRLTNRSGARVLVVLAVDGVNVISGETAGWNQTGYVLDPWRSFDITGWRKSDTAIAAFEFAALRDSYAARTGRPDNVGVIGMAVFNEKPAPPPEPPAVMAPEVSGQLLRRAPMPTTAANGQAESSSENRDESRAKSASRIAAAPPADARLGTAHGQREWSAISRTAFERLSSTPQAVVELAYDSWHNLVAAGVIKPLPTQAGVRSFPLSPDLPGYVPDPPSR